MLPPLSAITVLRIRSMFDEYHVIICHLPLLILIFSPPPFSYHYDIPVFITITTSATQSALGPGLSVHPVGCISGFLDCLVLVFLDGVAMNEISAVGLNTLRST